MHSHETPTQEVVIQGKIFHAPAPYSEGHVLSAGEANALNSLLRENLRNNFAGLMKRAAEEDEPKQLTQHDFDTYAAEYSFGLRTRRVAVDPVEREERRLTEAAVKRALMKKGLKLKDIPEETIAQHVKNVMATGRYREDAIRNVELKKASPDDLGIEI